MNISKLANIVLGGALGLCVGGLAYTSYRSESYTSETLQVFFVAFSAGIGLFAVAFMWGKEARGTIALVAVSSGLAVYLAEVFLLVFMPFNENIDIHRAVYAQGTGVPFDTRTKLQVILELRKKGVDAYPETRAVFLKQDGSHFVADSLYVMGNLAKRTIVHCNEAGEWMIFESDEHGFNNPKGVYKNQGLDILIIGDSFAEGSCVKPGEDIAGHLRKSGWSALNVGTSGNGPLIELATLKEYGEPLRPKKVFWVYYEGNDLQDLSEELGSSFLQQYLEENFSQGLLERQTEINRKLENHIANAMGREKAKVRQQWINDFVLIRILKLRELRKVFRSRSMPSDSFPGEFFQPVLVKAKERVTSWGGQLYFVYLPTWERYAGDLRHEEFLHRGHVLKVVKNLDIPLIDFHQILVTHPDPLSFFPFKIHGHYTAEAYGLVAQLIQTHLEEQEGRLSALH